jgi:hypothetical protein
MKLDLLVSLDRAGRSIETQLKDGCILHYPNWMEGHEACTNREVSAFVSKERASNKCFAQRDASTFLSKKFDLRTIRRGLPISQSSPELDAGLEQTNFNE